jgi:hypothetical protein
MDTEIEQTAVNASDLTAHINTKPLDGWGIPAKRDLQHFLVNRIPPLPKPGKSWPARAEKLRQRILADVVYKGVPKEAYESPVKVEWGETLKPGEGYTIRKLRYEAYPGQWTPALLYVPDKLEGKVPAVLCPNGHTGPSKAAVEGELRCINLAKRGILALHPDWIAFGEFGLGANWIHEHNSLAYLDLCGVSGVSVFYLNMKRALDVLLAHPNADAERVAMSGLSGGGWQTIFFSSLDTRITACAPNAGYINLLYRVFANDAGDVEQCANDMLLHADYDTLTAMLAPRPARLIYNAYDECCFQAHRALRAVYVPVQPHYKALGAADNFDYHVNQDPGTHNYDVDNRQAFYRFLNKHFSPPVIQDEDIDVRSDVLSFDELKCGLPEGNKITMASLAR